MDLDLHFLPQAKRWSSATLLEGESRSSSETVGALLCSAPKTFSFGLKRKLVMQRRQQRPGSIIRLSIDRQKALPQYVVCYINSPLGQQYIQSQLTRAIGQVNLNAQKLQAMPILLPSLKVQVDLVTYLEKNQAYLENLGRAHNESDSELQRMEQSILDKAFRGEL